MCQRHKSDLNKRTTFFESFVTVMKMKDIRTKSENTTPRQRAAARIPKEALHQLWLQGKEKSHVEIENEANAQQNGDYTEPAHTGEKIADALQSAGKSSAKVAIHKGRELAKKRAGQRHMEQSVERQEQTGQQSFSELQAPDGGQVSSNLTEPRECSVPSGKENPSANHSRISDSAKQTSDRNIKSNRLSVKEKPHDIKTAPHEIRGVSRDRKQIRTAASTVQAEQVAQQKAQQMAQRTRQAAKNASKQTLLTDAVEGCFMSGVGDTSANSIGIAYDAIVTPVSEAVTNTAIASVLFIIAWDAV